jgi:microcompartment protein CcmL/EutN
MVAGAVAAVEMATTATAEMAVEMETVVKELLH